MKTENNPHGLEVGQELYWVTTVNRSRYGKNEFTVKIAKIGRKWATLDQSYNPPRIDMKTLRVDGGDYTDYAICFLNKSDYLHSQKVSKLWGEIRKRFDSMRPQLSDDKILKIAEILEIDINQPAEEKT